MGEGNDFPEFVRLLRQDERPINDAATYHRLYRKLKAIAGGPEFRIALMGNTTLDPVVPFLSVELAREGWRASTRISPFGQYFQDLTSATFKAFDAQMIVLHLSLALLRRDAFATFAELSDDARRTLKNDILDEVEQWVALALAECRATLVVCNFPMPAVSSLGIADLAEDYGQTEFFLDLNRELLHRLRPHPRVQILDLLGAVASIGFESAFDARFLHLAKTDWTDALSARFSRQCARHLIAATGTARKCLVLDLDNTLWGGILGEDGPDGIRISQGDMHGEAFIAFQQRVRALKRRGILLGLCSKNELADVKEAFRRHPDMPLEFSDFSASAIGWGRKSDGIVEIAHQLGIASDAIVFMDDNPAEIAEVHAALPNVESVLLSSDPADYVTTLDRVKSFEKSRLTAEDIAKSAQYAEAASRAAAMATSSSPADYLTGLEMEFSIWSATRADITRIHQLFTKTNQFNVTTKRYTPGEIEAMIDAPECRLMVGSLRDRFGDFGTIGLYLAIADRGAARIDSFVISCRALGRGVETAFLNDLKQYVLTRTECAKIIATFIPTDRNEPAARVFDDAGFAAHAGNEQIDYELQRSDINMMNCGWLTVKEC